MSYTDLTKSESSRNCLRRIAHHDEPQFSKHSIVNVMEKFVKTVNAMDETILVPCRLMDRQVGDSTDIIPQPGKNSTANQLSSNNHGKRGSASSKNVHEFLNASELFNLYSMLNSLKNDLLWTGKDKAIEEEEEAAEAAARAEKENQNMIYEETTNLIRSVSENTAAQPTPVIDAAHTTTTATAKGHVRQPSTASIASCVSVSNSSDSESDSGMESDGNKCDINQSGVSTDSSSSSSSGSENDICSKKTANLDKATELAKRCKRHLNGLYQCLEQMTEAANYLTARYQSDIGGPV